MFRTKWMFGCPWWGEALVVCQHISAAAHFHEESVEVSTSYQIISASECNVFRINRLSEINVFSLCVFQQRGLDVLFLFQRYLNCSHKKLFILPHLGTLYLFLSLNHICSPLLPGNAPLSHLSCLREQGELSLTKARAGLITFMWGALDTPRELCSFPPEATECPLRTSPEQCSLWERRPAAVIAFIQPLYALVQKVIIY